MYFHQTNDWRLSEVNKDFSVCPSYPSLVAVPKDTDDDSLRKIATFRHGGRFPVLSYYHRKNGMVSTSDNEFTSFKMCRVDFNCVTACLYLKSLSIPGDHASRTATNRHQRATV